MVKNLLACRRFWFDHWVRKIPWRRKMVTHSSILAWRIPWMEEPGGLQSMGSQRVGHDSVTSLSSFFLSMALKAMYIVRLYKISSNGKRW